MRNTTRLRRLQYSLRRAAIANGVKVKEAAVPPAAPAPARLSFADLRKAAMERLQQLQTSEHE
jgi:hypothetical protein